jgi:hypothetical protein
MAKQGGRDGSHLEHPPLLHTRRSSQVGKRDPGKLQPRTRQLRRHASKATKQIRQPSLTLPHSTGVTQIQIQIQIA